MNNDQLQFLFFAVALPAAIGLLAGVAVRIAAAKGWLRVAAFAAPAAIGAAYLAAHWMIAGPPAFPPTTIDARLFFLAAGLTVLLAAAGASGRIGTAWAIVVLAALAAPVAAIWPTLRKAVGDGAILKDDLLLWTGGGGALACLLIVSPVVQTEREGHRRAAAIILGGVCAAAGAALALSGSMKLAQFALALAAAVLGLGLIVPSAKLGTSGRLGPTGFGIPSAMLAAILLGGIHYSYLPPIAAGVLALAPLAGLMVSRFPKIRPSLQIWVRVGTAALVAAAAVVTAVVMTQSGGSE